MSKPKMMSFADGLKEIKVGDVCVAPNGQWGRNCFVNSFTVETLGTKYAVMKCGTKFMYDNGYEKTNLNSTRLYSSREAYDSEKNKKDSIYRIRNLFNNLDVKQITDEQLNAIKEIAEKVTGY